MNVLIIGDTHCPGMLEGYVDHCVDIYKSWKCNKVIHIGDVVDWHCINYHGQENGTPNVEQEVSLAKKQIADLHKAFPKSTWLLGNHDVLPTRRMADVYNFPMGMLKSYIDFWEVPSWEMVPRFGTYEVDGVLYSHGESVGGMYPAILYAQKQFQSVVIGHHHAAFGVQWVANSNNLVFGMSVGCGVDHELLQFSYGKKYSRKPIVGCGVVLDGKYPICEPMFL